MASPIITSQYILGIDLGANSIGWAVVEIDGGRPSRLCAGGSRIFEAGVQDLETGRDTPRNEARRLARQQRRQTDRRARRHRTCFRLLQAWGLLPPLPPGEQDESSRRHDLLTRLDRELVESIPALRAATHAQQQVTSYRLRALALDAELPPHAIGRALYHLAQRRGFPSRSRAGETSEERKKELGVVKEGIQRLTDLIKNSGARTVGEYFSTLDPLEARIRTRFTERGMFQEEFTRIWDTQAKHHPEEMTAPRRRRLWNCLFRQRPLKSVARLIGKCTLEKGCRRAPKADPLFQRFRVLQTVNHLRWLLGGQESSLSAEQRAKTLTILTSQQSITFAQLKKSLGLPKGAKLSIEDGDKKGVEGNRTGVKLQAVFGERWEAFTPGDQAQIVGQLRTIDDADALARLGEQQWGLDPMQAAQFADVHLEDGYCAFSRRALRKLIPLMEQGLDTTTALDAAYPERRSTRVFETLPPVAKLASVRNPAVIRSLTELRKVVNNIIRTYGRPSEVHIELARDLKKSAEERKRILRDNEERRQLRETAKDIIQRTWKPKPTAEDIDKYLLAEECEWRCPYSGESIGGHDLFGTGRFDVEHIIPYARSFDDSFANKTLCIREFNTRKGAQTPLEAFGGTEEWEAMLERVRKFKGFRRQNPKLARFLMSGDGLADEFCQRQLNDTRYASRLAREYVSLLYGGFWDADGTQRVFALSGGVTAYLRRAWGLHAVLSDGPRDGEKQSKNRDDHRHHAVDAVVIALATPAQLKSLAEQASSADKRNFRRFRPVAPLTEFVPAVRKLTEQIVVSHRPCRTLRGSLHKATLYSPPDKSGRVHIRKRVADLTEASIEQICDPAVRSAVQEQLGRLGLPPKKAFADAQNHPFLTAADGRKIWIHKVRIADADSSTRIGEGARTRYVNTEDNHHLALYEAISNRGKPKIIAQVVPLLEAFRRKTAGTDVIRRSDETPGRFLCAIFKGDMLEVTEEDGTRQVLRVLSFSSVGSGGVDMELLLHTDARTQKERKAQGARIRVGAAFFANPRVRVVEVDPLGRVFPRSC